MPCLRSEDTGHTHKSHTMWQFWEGEDFGKSQLPLFCFTFFIIFNKFQIFKKNLLEILETFLKSENNFSRNLK